MVFYFNLSKILKRDNYLKKLLLKGYKNVSIFYCCSFKSKKVTMSAFILSKIACADLSRPLNPKKKKSSRLLLFFFFWCGALQS